MKANLRQQDNVTFKPYAYWSNWIDLQYVCLCTEVYLLQYRVSRFNEKSFRATEIPKTCPSQLRVDEHVH